jgi:quinol monooxygenase YgiN
LEEWASQEDLDAHGKAAPFVKWVPVIGKLADLRLLRTNTVA